MRTEIVETSYERPDAAVLDRAAEVIRRGGIVAVPTDALYVLAADPFNLNAVAAVFRAKGRESHRALPILVDSIEMAEDYAATPLDARFYQLARRFWPGPLTLIVASSSKLPLKVTGNSGRLAVRRSDAPIAQELTIRLNSPIIATSANVSGQPTCSSGIDVFGTMDGRVDLILDAGAVSDAPATTLDITEREWKLIREGALTQRRIEDFLDE